MKIATGISTLLLIFTSVSFGQEMSMEIPGEVQYASDDEPVKPVSYQTQESLTDYAATLGSTPGTLTGTMSGTLTGTTTDFSTNYNTQSATNMQPVTTMQLVPVTTMQMVPVTTMQPVPVQAAPVVQSPVVQAPVAQAPIIQQTPPVIQQAPAPQPIIIVVQAPPMPAPMPAPMLEPMTFFEFMPAPEPVFFQVFEAPVYRKKKCCLFGCH